MNPSEFRTAYAGQRIGVTASCFDLMHAGHVLLLKEAKNMVDLLVVFLQTDPTVDRPSKNKPILSMEERRILVEGCKYVDHIFEYTTEAELLQGLIDLQPDMRFLGDDYVGKQFTGCELNIPVHFHNRSVHGWSTSALRKKICEEGKRVEEARIEKIEMTLGNQFTNDIRASFIDKFGTEGRLEFQTYFDENRADIERAIRMCAEKCTTSEPNIYDWYDDIFKIVRPPFAL
jgi:glycerol-3-phosphate cytidylyltransferase